MGKIIALANQKRWCRKKQRLRSNLCELSACYTRKKVELVKQKRRDPQANASSGLGVDIKKPSECTIYECIIDRANVQDVSYP